LLDFAQTALQVKPFLDDRNQHVGAYRSPNLGLHGIQTRTVESLDSQMLFDPFEEEFDLPATFVELGDRQRRQGEVVAQKDTTGSMKYLTVGHAAA
jgi:hypothetical protein